MSQQMIGAAVKGLKPCKRYIATHDSNGTSVYAESPEQVFNAVPGVGGLARSFSVDAVPANLTDEVSISMSNRITQTTQLPRVLVFDIC
jgi:hypothetical protein